ncbi:unnamed protein product [Caenorhabditis angaria]|uniref:non-specific serine/threonine protein kinase n=1 Tax=Caenorhabditis angaria TaxID=860376 RepID=A0A9P1IHJ0_9PELO|nr:unnamed protein product [Caenorhabditis angaria]
MNQSSSDSTIKDGEEYTVYNDEKIGRGAYSEVYKGRTKAGRLCAIKVARKKSDIDSMMTEIEILKNLKGVPNIVQYIGSVVKKSNGNGIIVTFAMELALGSLENLMRQPENAKGLRENEICDFIMDCCKLLRFAFR